MSTIYTRQYDDEYVISLEEEIVNENGMDFKGFVLKTSRDSYYFLIDGFTPCCEEYGVNILSNIHTCVGRQLEKITWREWTRDYNDDKKFVSFNIYFTGASNCNNSSDSDGSFIGSFIGSLDYDYDDETLSTFIIIEIYNYYHNGYYPRNYLVKFNDFKDTDEL